MCGEIVNDGFWNNRRVLITGHTGFKGAWLAIWLGALGARVNGIALPPSTSPSMFDLTRPNLDEAIIGDIRNLALVSEVVQRIRPELIIHLAAQALVHPSYADPIETFSTNVMGTANLLEVARHLSGTAVLIVTSDKVYENTEDGRPFEEDDRLGGHDPYSTSKACAELVTTSYRRSFYTQTGVSALASARAGNVIGGGDWSRFRLVPDVIRARDNGTLVQLRQPHSIRPWQHVLDPLHGYLLQARMLLDAPERAVPALNFAPYIENCRPARELVESLAARFGGRPQWTTDSQTHPREAGLLRLSAAKAEALLGWSPRLDFAQATAWVADWYEAFWSGKDMRAVTLAQIANYEKLVCPPAVIDRASINQS